MTMHAVPNQSFTATPMIMERMAEESFLAQVLKSLERYHNEDYGEAEDQEKSRRAAREKDGLVLGIYRDGQDREFWIAQALPHEERPIVFDPSER